jgi:Ni,Fe-hydrogenase III component G
VDLAVRHTFAFRGRWAYDAISPDGRTVYLIEALSGTDANHYLVRAYDLRLGRLVAGAVADKSEKGAMAGYPLSRVSSAGGVWVYTLYMRPGGNPFIHALDTRDRAAVCIDLSWRGTSDLSGVSLSLSRDGRRLVVHGPNGRTVASVRTPN